MAECDCMLVVGPEKGGTSQHEIRHPDHLVHVAAAFDLRRHGPRHGNRVAAVIGIGINGVEREGVGGRSQRPAEAADGLSVRFGGQGQLHVRVRGIAVDPRAEFVARFPDDRRSVGQFGAGDGVDGRRQVKITGRVLRARRRRFIHTAALAAGKAQRGGKGYRIKGQFVHGFSFCSFHLFITDRFASVVKIEGIFFIRGGKSFLGEDRKEFQVGSLVGSFHGWQVLPGPSAARKIKQNK